MDIDIDFPTSFDPLELFEQAVRASMIQNGELKKHPCGIYFQHIAKDPITDLSAIPYKQAEKYGYFKIDFLHLSVYDFFETKQEIRTLLKTEPDWSMLRNPSVVEKLFHLANWQVVLDLVEPTSIEELADCLALIRPKKQHLMHTYTGQETRKELFDIEPGDKTSFKRSHAIAYAHVIVLQLHLIKGGIL